MAVGNPSRTRRPLTRLLVLLGSCLTCFLGCELVFRLVATKLHHAVRYESDPQLGWRFVPDIRTTLVNSAGAPYVFRTNQDGWAFHDLDRGIFSAQDRRRVIILGDSFAEGEGVGAEVRFDAVATRATNRAEFRAVGCGGYSTEQQLILMRQVLHTLRAGDHVVLLTCSNDISDLAFSSHSGRRKPVALQEGGAVMVVPPELGFRDWIRSRSWMASFVIGRLLPGERTRVLRAEDCGPAYVGLVRAMAMELPPEVGLHVAFHTGNGPGFSDTRLFDELTESGIPCTNLDAILGERTSRPGNFLPCGHWTESGNLVAANWFAENFK